MTIITFSLLLHRQGMDWKNRVPWTWIVSDNSLRNLSSLMTLVHNLNVRILQRKDEDKKHGSKETRNSHHKNMRHEKSETVRPKSSLSWLWSLTLEETLGQLIQVFSLRDYTMCDFAIRTTAEQKSKWEERKEKEGQEEENAGGGKTRDWKRERDTVEVSFSPE